MSIPVSPILYKKVQQYIELEAQVHYRQALHSRPKARIEALEQELLLKDARIKDLQNRLFGKKSEKQRSSTSQQGGVSETTGRNRGQQPGRPGHGRTPRPNLTVMDETIDLAEPAKQCAVCGLPFCAKPALDEVCEIIEVQSKFRYGQPIHRYCQDLRDLGLPVSPGTIANGL